jgi:hypothetical protein
MFMRPRRERDPNNPGRHMADVSADMIAHLQPQEDIDIDGSSIDSLEREVQEAIDLER